MTQRASSGVADGCQLRTKSADTGAWSDSSDSTHTDQSPTVAAVAVSASIFGTEDEVTVVAALLSGPVPPLQCHDRFGAMRHGVDVVVRGHESELFGGFEVHGVGADVRTL